MLKNSIIELFERDLTRLKDEINLYTDESKLWITEKEINNSAGNLVLHLLGNLNHFIGSTLGNSGYVRQREKEFSNKDIPRQEMLGEIDKTSVTIKNTVGKMNEEDFNNDYPLEVFKNKGKMKTEFFLVHLTGHLNYHLGQINYHRRLIG
ncbi:MAG: DUF1572 family protein [Ignavibacteriaceae bacterium]